MHKRHCSWHLGGCGEPNLEYSSIKMSLLQCLGLNTYISKSNCSRNHYLFPCTEQTHAHEAWHSMRMIQQIMPKLRFSKRQSNIKMSKTAWVLTSWQTKHQGQGKHSGLLTSGHASTFSLSANPEPSKLVFTRNQAVTSKRNLWYNKKAHLKMQVQGGKHSFELIWVI